MKNCLLKITFMLFAFSSLQSNAQCPTNFNHSIDPTLCTVNFEYSTAVINFAMTWDFGDGMSYYTGVGNGTAGGIGTHSIEHVYENGTYYVSAHYVGNSCDTTFYDTITVNCQTSPNPCDAQFSYSYITCDSVLFTPNNIVQTSDYLWIQEDNSGNFSTEPITDFLFYLTGLRDVYLQVIDSTLNCSSSSIQSVLIETDCGLNIENDNLEINWFPNPTADFLKPSKELNGQLQIFSLDGRLVKSLILNSENVINVTDLMPGTYVLFYEDKIHNQTKKSFVKF